MEFIISLIALVTASISLVGVFINRCELKKQEEEIKTIIPCSVEIKIRDPKDGDQVPSQVDVIGMSTVHEECQYVFIFVRGAEPPANYWRVTDLVQVNTNGQWAGKALLDEVPIGTEATIEARVAVDPQSYRTGQRLSIPPTKGARSSQVRVRRVL